MDGRPTLGQLQAWGAWARQLQPSVPVGTPLSSWGERDYCTSGFYAAAVARAASHKLETPLGDENTTRNDLMMGRPLGADQLEAKRASISRLWYSVAGASWWPLWVTASVLNFALVPPALRGAVGVLQWMGMGMLQRVQSGPQPALVGVGRSGGGTQRPRTSTGM